MTSPYDVDEARWERDRMTEEERLSGDYYHHLLDAREARQDDRRTGH